MCLASKTGNRWRATVLCWLTAACAMAAPTLNYLDIRVRLQPNGDARISETRHMLIDGEGTECYIVIGNLSGSQLRDLEVTDETGREYFFEGAWEIHRSRGEKAGRCGIVSTGSGYEVCWGLGESGERTYTTTYTLTNLVKGYQDADGFNYMFVATGLQPLPGYVRLTIASADTTLFTTANTGIWAFRYRGEVNLTPAGTIVAESSEPFSRESAMIVMARFEKGLFAPAVETGESFEDVKQRAFDGSDYPVEGDDVDWHFLLLVLFFFIMPVLMLLVKMFRIWRARRRLKRNVNYYRDIPFNGDLTKANKVLNAYRYVNKDYNNLLSAGVMRLINLGAIGLQPADINNKRASKEFTINELKDEQHQNYLVRQLHYIFSQAAGSDRVLQAKELTRWIRNHEDRLEGFVNHLHGQQSLSDCEQDYERVCQLFGLKKFLEDFSLVGERHVEEVALWNEYLVYATLFGIADQVAKDMKKINPEYFQLNFTAQEMTDTVTLPVFINSMHTGTRGIESHLAEKQAREHGGGGSASWGGGGGFSGGGMGGGVR